MTGTEAREAPRDGVKGAYFAASFGAGLAGDAVGRQQPVKAVRDAYMGEYSDAPGMVVVAVRNGLEDRAAEAIKAALDIGAGEGPDTNDGEDNDG